MKKIKKAIWIPSLVVGIIVIAVLTLSLIRVSPIENTFGGYSRVELLRSNRSEFTHVIDADGNDLTKQALESGLGSSSFSVMQAILEGKFSYKARLQMSSNSDGEQAAMVTASAINAFSAFEGEYVIKLYYDQTKTVTIDGKEIKFDRLLVRLYETNGEVQEIECVPYLEYNVNNESTSDEYDEEGRIGSIYYNANVVEIKMNTSKFMASIAELLEKYE